MSDKEFSNSLSHILVKTCRMHRAATNKLLDERGVHAGQDFILKHLWREDGLTHSELAYRLQVQPATITKMVNRMTASGLVERRKDSQDQRISRVYLTDKGHDLRKIVTEAWESLETIMTESLTLEERLLLRRLLMQLQKNIEQNLGQFCS